MFEFSIAKKYLWPKRKQLSVSLIGLLSVFVISLVIWLLLLFLSITEGIEKNWLSKVTSLNAPLRILPTEEYYNSYFYQIDAISSKSDYHLKSIGEKLIAETTDPYCPENDEEPPFYWPIPDFNQNNQLKDLVKEVFTSVTQVGQLHQIPLQIEDYEVAGALMRLRQVRQGDSFSSQNTDAQSFLTQATYIASITENKTALYDLLEPPSMKDLNHLIYLADRIQDTKSANDKPTLHSERRTVADRQLLRSILSNIVIKQIATNPSSWQLDPSLLTEKKSYEAYARFASKQLMSVIVPVDANVTFHNEMVKGSLEKVGDALCFQTEGKSYPIHPLVPVFADRKIVFDVISNTLTLPASMSSISDCSLRVKTLLQGEWITGEIPYKEIELVEAEVTQTFLQEPDLLPPWYIQVSGTIKLPEGGILLPNNFREYNVLMGDSGYLSYGSATPTSMQEQRLFVRVAGFYDPGVMAVGARFALSDRFIPRHINESSQSMTLDPMLSNGIQVWFKDLKKTPLIAREITAKLDREGLSAYWKVVPFYNYEFAKDLMEQFQSDRYLFMLIGVIILFVACSNIISLLLLLVNDKKQEIGILLSLGAKKRSIATIFGLCGIAMGVASCLVGSFAAYFTLHHIDALVHILNTLEGRDAFNSVFYGTSLPNTLSKDSLVFIVATTPIVSMLAGLIPAIKACRLKPSAILRSDS